MAATDILRETRKWRQYVENTLASLLSAGGSGVWEELDDTTISGSPANYQLTWDETLYDAIEVRYSGIQPATDATSLFCRVGSADGATIYSGASDYDGSEKLYEDAAWSNSYYAASEVRIGASHSNAVNETASGTIIISAFDDADLGCLIRSDLLYINSVSNQRANEVKAFLDGQNVAIDTVQLLWSSGNFANNGRIRVLGLTK